MATRKSSPAKKAAKKTAKKTKPAAKKPTPKPKKAVIKTVETSASVDKFINAIESEQKRKDCFVIVEMMEKATKAKAKMWGSSIIGFGNRVVTSPATGRSVDWLVIGFSPRKANITLYLTTTLHSHPAELKKLGKYKTGGGCLYINKLEDVDLKVLKGLIETAAKQK